MREEKDEIKKGNRRKPTKNVAVPRGSMTVVSASQWEEENRGARTKEQKEAQNKEPLVLNSNSWPDVAQSIWSTNK